MNKLVNTPNQITAVLTLNRPIMRNVNFCPLFLLTIMAYMSYTNLYSQTLVWSDEFDYTGLPDASKWGNEVGYIRNNELQYYTDRDIDNQIVRNGNLEITALRESHMGYEYTSASINTLGKASWTYGKIEARMKLPMGQGIWPAFWTLGTNINSVGWPACGEIDIMEHINNETVTYGTAHWAGTKGGRHTSSGGSFGPIDVTQYHVYSMVWNSKTITWYVDDIKYHQVNIEGGVNGTSELHQPQYILLNLAIGGNWPGSPDATTVFPATYFIDYVRVYENSDIPLPLTDLTLEAEQGYCFLHSDLVRTTTGVTNWDYGRFIKYCGSSLSDQYKYLNFHFSSSSSGTLQVQLNGNRRTSTTVATLNFSSGANQVVQVPTSGITSGNHDVYITGRGGNLELDKIVFTANSSPASRMSLGSKGFNDLEVLTNDIKVFPVPAKNSISIEFTSQSSGPGDLSLVDANGRALLNDSVNIKKGINTFSLKVSSLARGAYIVRIKSKDIVGFKKIFID